MSIILWSMSKLCLLSNNKFILIHRTKLVANFLVGVCFYFNNQIYKVMIAINNKKILLRKIIILSKLSKFKIRSKEDLIPEEMVNR